MNIAINFILHINPQLFMLFLFYLARSGILRQECQSAKHDDLVVEIYNNNSQDGHPFFFYGKKAWGWEKKILHSLCIN